MCYRFESLPQNSNYRLISRKTSKLMTDLILKTHN